MITLASLTQKAVACHCLELLKRIGSLLLLLLLPYSAFSQESRLINLSYKYIGERDKEGEVLLTQQKVDSVFLILYAKDQKISQWGQRLKTEVEQTVDIRRGKNSKSINGVLIVVPYWQGHQTGDCKSVNISSTKVTKNITWDSPENEIRHNGFKLKFEIEEASMLTIPIKVTLYDQSAGTTAMIVNEKKLIFSDRTAEFSINGLQPNTDYLINIESPSDDADFSYSFNRSFAKPKIVKTLAPPKPAKIDSLRVIGVPKLCFYKPTSKEDSTGMKILFTPSHHCKAYYDVVSADNKLSFTSKDKVSFLPNQVASILLKSSVLPKGIENGNGFTVTVYLEMLDGSGNTLAVSETIMPRHNFSIGLVVEKPTEKRDDKQQKNAAETAKKIGGYVGMGLKALIGIFL